MGGGVKTAVRRKTCTSIIWLAAGAKGHGKSLSAIDGLIAATAVHHNLTIVSRNTSDFSNVPVPVVSPWEA